MDDTRHDSVESTVRGMISPNHMKKQKKNLQNKLYHRFGFRLTVYALLMITGGFAIWGKQTDEQQGARPQSSVVAIQSVGSR